MKLKGVTPATMRKAYLKQHEAINDYFLNGVKGGQFVCWIESNVVYNITKQATLKDIPCLTVHDEFIVPKKHKAKMLELMYDDPTYTKDDPFDYRGYYKWREHRGEIAPSFKGSMAIEF